MQTHRATSVQNQLLQTAMCKHVAATLYGIGARLDVEPELLFGLRKVDAKELIARAGEGGTPRKAKSANRVGKRSARGKSGSLDDVVRLIASSGEARHQIRTKVIRD